MSSNSDNVTKAAEKAGAEVQQASIAVLAGVDPAEAVAEKVKDGPEDVVGELSELNEKNRNNPEHNQSRFIETFKGSDERLKFTLSKSGNVFIPLMDDTVSSILGLPQHRNNDLETRRRERERLAKSGETVSKILKTASDIQMSTQVPATVVPYIGKLLTPTLSLLSFIPPLVQLVVWRWMKRGKV